MIRRQFLKLAGGLIAGLALPLRVKAKDVPSFPMLGKYVSHDVVRNEVWEDFGRVGNQARFICWPIEVKLNVRFENGSITWVNFNGTRDLVRRLKAMAPHELLSNMHGWEENEAKLVFKDEVSSVWEIDPSWHRPKYIPGKTAKFVMQILSCLDYTKC